MGNVVSERIRYMGKRTEEKPKRTRTTSVRGDNMKLHVKTKKPKRIKTWVNEYDWGVGIPRDTKGDAVAHSFGALRVGVRLIELHRGEVVVNSDALADAVARKLDAQCFGRLIPLGPPDFVAAVLAAIKKVGVR